jgi:hypothetical protein
VARRREARPATSQQVKDWERQRRAAEAERRAGREDTGVGERLREVRPVTGVGGFEAKQERFDGTERVARCVGVGEQQRRSLTRSFEAQGWEVTRGRVG